MTHDVPEFPREQSRYEPQGFPLVGSKMALLTPDKSLIKTFIEFYNAPDGSAHSTMYAPVSGSPRALRGGLDSMAAYNRLKRLRDDGCLIDATEVLFALSSHMYEVIDERITARWRIYFGTQSNLPVMKYGLVYLLQPDGEADPVSTDVPPISFDSEDVFWSYIMSAPGFEVAKETIQRQRDDVSMVKPRVILRVRAA